MLNYSGLEAPKYIKLRIDALNGNITTITWIQSSCIDLISSKKFPLSFYTVFCLGQYIGKISPVIQDVIKMEYILIVFLGQGLWRGFLWLAFLSTNSGLHVRSSICLSLSISWNLYRVFDEEKQRHLILAEYTVVHVGFFVLFLNVIIWNL
jgi:hypothetical protein